MAHPNPFQRFYDASPRDIEGCFKSIGSLDRNSPDVVQHIDDHYILNEFPNLQPFYRALSHIIHKFDYLDTSEDDWQSGYVFPDAYSFWADSFNVPTDNDTNYINRNSQTETDWFSELVNYCNPDSRIDYPDFARYFVTGEIGTGKSTFLKRGLKLHRPQFVANSVIPARIEFSKVSCSLPSEEDNPGKQLRHAIIKALYRELHHHFGDESTGTSFIDHPHFGEKFRAYVQDRYVFQSERGNYNLLATEAIDYVDFNFSRARRYFQLQRDERRNDVLGTDIIFQQLSIYYTFSHLSHSYLLIFDGFDYLTAADILFNTKNSERIHQLHSVHAGSNYFPILDEISAPLDTHQIFVMRDVTYARYLDRNPGVQGSGHRRHFRVAGPASRQLTERAIARVCKRLNVEDQSAELLNFDKFVRRLLRSTIVGPEEFEASDTEIRSRKTPIAPINLFNGNARKQLEFLLFTIRMMVREVLPEVDPAGTFADDPRSLFDVVKKEDFQKSLNSKRYRFIGLMLSRDTMSFRNSLILPERDSCDPKSIIEREAIGNYIDNIYNYDESNNAPFALMSKIRVCELVRSNPLTASEISRFLKTEYTNNCDRLLAIMCRTGLLKTRRKHGDVVFQTEPLGLLTIDHLTAKTEYVEHLFPHTSLPIKLRSAGIAAYSRTSMSQRSWAIASLLNCFLMLKIVQDVESRERQAGNSWNWIAPRLMHNHGRLNEFTHRRFSDKSGRLDHHIEDKLKTIFG